jgi:hypothetical protein
MSIPFMEIDDKGGEIAQIYVNASTSRGRECKDMIWGKKIELDMV